MPTGTTVVVLPVYTMCNTVAVTGSRCREYLTHMVRSVVYIKWILHACL